MTIARALALAAAADGRAYPKPTVGAVVVSDGEVVGEGATERAAATARSSRSTRAASGRAARRST
jgi:diaminohydroxyphosphoribosylaminopyrimidine deaminase/5-amino-6-(5-phosphoribosylamino)uracil reductase